MALGLCTLGLVSFMNVNAWPRINHLYFGCFALFFSLIGNAPTPILLLRASAFFAMGIFIRPESFVPSMLCFILGTGVTIYRFKSRKIDGRDSKIWWPTLVFSICLWFSSQTILNNNRGTIAFMQHYAFTKFKAGLTTIQDDPWMNYLIIIREDFKPFSSPRAAYQENPTAINRHLKLNIRFLIEYLTFWPGDLFAGSAFNNFSLMKRNTLGGILLTFLLVMAWKIRSKENIVLLNTRGFALVSLLVILPLLGICIFLHPREHYQIQIFWICILFMGIRFGNKFSNWMHWIFGLVVACTFLLVKPDYNDRSMLKMEQRKHFYLVEYLKNSGLDSGGVISSGANYPAYLGPNWFSVSPSHKKDALKKYLVRNKVEIIVCSKFIKKLQNSDLDWKMLFADPISFGFDPIKVNHFPDTLLVRRN
jgi:hypothetical protein